jgi:thioredoxin 1
MAIHVKSSEFENVVLKSEVPVLVDFFATWCGPCKMIAPSIDQLSTEMEGKAKIVKIDIDESGDLAGNYKVMSVPTLMFFKGGKPVDQIVGAVPKTTIENKLNSLM